METTHPQVAAAELPVGCPQPSATPCQPSARVGSAGQARTIWPVYGFAADGYFKREPVASFLDWGAAVDLANHPDRDGFEQRNLYIGVPQYDRRSVPPIPARHLRHLLDGEAL